VDIGRVYCSHKRIKRYYRLPRTRDIRECGPDDLAPIRDLFHLFDLNDSGFISPLELRDGLLRFGSEPTNDGVLKMANEVAALSNTEHAKLVDFHGFARGLLLRETLLYKHLYEEQPFPPLAGPDAPDHELDTEKRKMAQTMVDYCWGGSVGATRAVRSSTGSDSMSSLSDVDVLPKQPKAEPCPPADTKREPLLKQ